MTSPSSGTDITSSGKFTTANFREAAVTHSPANLFMLEQEKKVKNLEARKPEYKQSQLDKKEAASAASAAANRKSTDRDASRKSLDSTERPKVDRAGVDRGQGDTTAATTAARSSVKKEEDTNVDAKSAGISLLPW